MTESSRGEDWSSIQGHGRNESIRLDREDRAIDPLEDRLGGVADEEAGDAGAGNGPHHDQVNAAGLRKLRDHVRRVALEQVHEAATGLLGEPRKEMVESLPGLSPRVLHVAFDLRLRNIASPLRSPSPGADHA